MIYRICERGRIVKKLLSFLQEVFMSRIIDCPCGHQLIGANDEELFALARQHVTAHHPGMQRTDDELQQLIRERARDGTQTAELPV
jgi:hypothetical protein